MTSTQVLELILSLSLQAAVVVIAAHLIGRRLPTASAHCRLWAVTFLLLLGLVIAAVTLPHPRLLPPVPTGHQSPTARLVMTQIQAGRILLAVWLTGCAVSAGRFAWQMIQAARFLRMCHPVDADVISLDALFAGQDGASVSGPLREIRLVSSRVVSSPFCWQFHRPCIVLPESLLTQPADALRDVIHHELEHLRTGHPLQVFVQRTVECLFWFHPLVWWGSRQAGLTREFACDDAVVSSPRDAVRYLRTLLSIAEQNVPDADRPALLAFARNRSLLAERARRLARQNRNQTRGAAPPGRPSVSPVVASPLLVAVALVTSTLWLPINAMAAPDTSWSPWPSWTARVLHEFGIQARDFEPYGYAHDLHELLEHESDAEADH